MKHACILFCYNNYEHIIRSYESLKTPNIDFYILENKSKYSDKIESYFKLQDIKGYVQFDNNISNNSIPIYFRDYRYLFTDYDYLTFTDCDLEVEDSFTTFTEIIKNLNIGGVGMSCVDLSMENFPHHIPGSGGWIPRPRNITDEYIECPTGGHLMTLKKENFDVFFNTDPFIDGILLSVITSRNLLWVKTKISKANHLTWDLYKEDEEYYQFKKNNMHIWNHSETSNYTQII
jgi:hypothetical protein